MTNRERVLAAFNCQPVDRVPASFWYHFLERDGEIDATEDTSLLDTLYERQRHFIETVKPDFVKIMCDGLARYPSPGFLDYKSVEDFSKFEALDSSHPWIRAHVNHALRVSKLREDSVYLYTIFSPSSLFCGMNGFDTFMKVFKENPQELSDGLKRIGEGLANLAVALMNEGGMDGIYYCVRNQNIAEISDEDQEKYFGEADRIVLNAANAIRDTSTLHICGYNGKRNRISAWKDYPAKVYHWASNVEGVSLSEGKKIFNGRCVMGGFGQQKGDVLNVGSEAEIKAATKKIVADAGKEGLVLAADCSLPAGIDNQHLVWVLEALEEMK